MNKTYKLTIILTTLAASIGIMIFAIIFLIKANETNHDKTKTLFDFNNALELNKGDESDTSYFKNIKVDEVNQMIYVDNVHMGELESYKLKASRSYIDSLSTTKLLDMQSALSNEDKLNILSFEHKTTINKNTLIFSIVISSFLVFISITLALEAINKKEVGTKWKIKNLKKWKFWQPKEQTKSSPKKKEKS
ncbi:hypothetical protein [Candidatus Mycoplasma mahonii]|uniref:hypothetical protein n=1 Tax=Candidatus Mycoplasma mahonii TaxID=3004105 RepID=UPI0026EC4EA9|nr:hypothetical protein [Candidatus Mycoplasma mahonii]WKX02277.1 hypothetical protein O3I44_02635 [Candidatus Mycoplasma mahonii]